MALEEMEGTRPSAFRARPQEKETCSNYSGQQLFASRNYLKHQSLWVLASLRDKLQLDLFDKRAKNCFEPTWFRLTLGSSGYTHRRSLRTNMLFDGNELREIISRTQNEIELRDEKGGRSPAVLVRSREQTRLAAIL